MEFGHPAAPSHSPVLDHHPPHEPTTVVEDEEQPHEKKSIMTRIQNKVNKLKHNYNKKRHAHDQASEVPVEEESEEFDDSNEDMDVDSEASSNPSVYESLATSREFDGEHGPLVTPETVKPPPVTFETDKPRGRDDPPVTFPTDKPPVFGGRDEPPVTFPTDKPPVFGGRDEPPITFPTDKPPVFGGRDEPPITLETDKPPVLGGREEPPVTLETEKPYVLGGRDEPPVTFPTDESQVRDEPAVRDEPPVTFPTDESQVRDEPETAVLGGRDKPSVTFETDKPHFFGGRDKLETDKPYVIGDRDEPPVTPETKKATTVEEEPVAPLPYGSLPRTTEDDTNLPTSVGPTPGNESSVPPEVLNSLQAMSISWSETQKDPEDEILVNHMSPDIEKKPSYTEKLGTTAAADEAAAPARTVSGPTGTPPTSYSGKLSSTAFAAKDAAVSAASMVYGKVAGKEEGTHSSETGGEVVTPVSNVAGTEEGAGEKKGSYTDRAYAAKDAAVMTASTMYGKMVGAGAAMMGNVVDTEQDKGSVREFSAEKGGEEDEVVKGKIELPEVTSREVVSDAPAEVLTDAPPAVDAKSGGYTGHGMVEMITGAFNSFVGGGGGVADAPAASGGGGRGGVADTPAVVVEAPSGGAGKERESEVLGE